MTPEQRQRKNAADQARRARLRAADPEGYRQREADRKRGAYESPEARQKRLARKRSTYREQVKMTPLADPWTIREDGVFDDLAVQIAADGIRRVRLTKTERRAAVQICADRGLTCKEIAERLFVSESYVACVLQESEREAA